MINNIVFKIINYGSFISVEYPWPVTCEANAPPNLAFLKNKWRSASFNCQSRLGLRPLKLFFFENNSLLPFDLNSNVYLSDFCTL